MVPTKTMGKRIMLDVCGGECPLGGDYINVDMRPLPEVDIIADITKRLPFDDDSVDEIFSCGTLEHFELFKAKEIVSEFHLVLCSGGTLVIGVPDADAVYAAYKKGEIDFAVFNQYLYGGQAHGLDYHKCVYDFRNMRTPLEQTGFKNVERREYDMPFHKKELIIKVVCNK